MASVLESISLDKDNVYGQMQGASAGKTKRHVFQITCEMQPGLDLLRPDYRKERNKQEQGGLKPQRNKKKMT